MSANIDEFDREVIAECRCGARVTFPHGKVWTCPNCRFVWSLLAEGQDCCTYCRTKLVEVGGLK